LKIEHEKYVREIREAEALVVQLKQQEPDLRKQWTDSMAQTEGSITTLKNQTEEVLLKIRSISSEQAQISAHNDAIKMHNDVNK
jgi:hypothetical protein